MDLFGNTAQTLMALGLFLAVIDVVVFGFATFFLTLIGLSMLVTGGLIYASVLPDQFNSILLSVAILSAVFAVLLWKPLQQLQKKQQLSKVTTDLTGITFVLEQDVSPANPGKYHYSGVDWKVEASVEIRKGQTVEVTELQVGIMKVVPKG
jgi:hypothetical protein